MIQLTIETLEIFIKNEILIITKLSNFMRYAKAIL